ncbi:MULTISPECIES: RnfH family protein [unclassified Idiomarina]|jgi:putative ubiquitin-RnfH superfamily antitoxin RatB of RatAB toxin-antitoxin module|uniref:RnfH family protein n=1 Tax=unclassified Idiomarina TaxID=2614829 RepID=UPI000C8BCA13|nr:MULTISPECIES: RnfH family protein [unclassified Idiomarina]MAD53989.1 RnfH family protein [Idiomarinaceae bacterium]MEC7644256.1 RnfH family protein [Pseudomonadota bacterium]MEC9320531.1 RnfH family protein [Pseudomonadota bacterium]NQZ03811.1 RnfH family protein [Idiomarina sp.]
MAMMVIEVAYATPERQAILTVTVAEGTDVKTCIERSGILEQFTDIDLGKQKVGIWSKATKLDAQPRDGDRIEIYRPLIADPKAIRKKRAERAKQEGRADRVTGGRPDAKRRTSD